MRKQTWNVLWLVGLILSVTWLGVTQVAAQGPTNTNPGSAVYIDNQWHAIPPNTTLWYLFDYNGDRSIIEMVLLDGFTNKLEFSVYTPDQITPTSIGTPIGRGAAPQVSCDTGKCPSAHLLWKGNFAGPGTFFVEVINRNAINVPLGLVILGGGVTLRVSAPPPVVASPAVPVVVPVPAVNILQAAVIPAIAAMRAPLTATIGITPTMPLSPTTTISPTLSLSPEAGAAGVLPPPIVVSPAMPVAPAPTRVNVYWTDAAWIMDNAWLRQVPGNAERWFAFRYAGDRTRIEIRIPGGNESKLAFRVYTSEQVLRYLEENRSVGDGTPGLVTCDAGKCPSNDLTWTGDFMIGGTYFIQVTNRNPETKNFQLSVTGSGVILGP